MVVAVILAAGEGSRFASETHKLLASLHGRPVVAHAVDHALAADLNVIVVTGAVDLTPAIGGRCFTVHNRRWADGQASSAHLGLELAAELGHDAVVLGLGDQPFLAPGAWRRVAAADAPIGIATYGGRRGHPVRLSSQVWPLLPTVGDEVGRAVFGSRPDLVREIPCDGEPADIDTVEDLDRWS